MWNPGWILEPEKKIGKIIGQLGTGSVGHLTVMHQQSCMVFVVVVFGLC